MTAVETLTSTQCPVHYKTIRAMRIEEFLLKNLKR